MISFKIFIQFIIFDDFSIVFDDIIHYCYVFFRDNVDAHKFTKFYVIILSQ